jgi:alcohol dehydrogenase (NADP+)
VRQQTRIRCLAAPLLAYACSPEAVAQTWRVLEQAHQKGQVRGLGVSNFTSTKLRALLSYAVVPPVCNQVELHPYFPQTELVEWSKAHDIVVTAYCPLGSPARPENFRSSDEPIDVLKNAVVARIAEAHGKSPAQVLIRWALQRGTVPLPKSVTPVRIAQNFNVFDFELGEGDMTDIAALSCGCRYFKGANMLREGETLAQLWDEEVFSE